MTETLTPDTIGPVDIAVVVFPGNRFNGEIAPALAALHDWGTVRILDLTFVSKDAAGHTTYVEVEDADVSEQYAQVKGHTFDLLSDEDLEKIGDDLDPESLALVVVWENSWGRHPSPPPSASRTASSPPSCASPGRTCSARSTPPPTTRSRTCHPDVEAAPA